MLAREQREFATFCNYCKKGVQNEEGKGAVDPTTDQQDNQVGLEDRRDQPEDSVDTLHVCARLPQQLTPYKHFAVFMNGLDWIFCPTGRLDTIWACISEADCYHLP